MNINEFRDPELSTLKKFVFVLLYYLKPISVFFKKLFVMRMSFQLEES